MARPLDHFATVAEDPVETASRRRLDRATVRALGSALAALAIATTVVAESTSALDPQGTATTNAFESGTITLLDDDQGRSLLDLRNMAPGRPVERCIAVEYAGTVLPVELSLAVDVTGDIADYVSVRVERGLGGGFDSCDGFVPQRVTYDGTLGDLAAAEPTDVGVFREDGDLATFRFRLDLLDDAAAAGRSGSVDFVWEAAPR
ncbi:MAG: hypothetical protein ACE37B_07370 [Ilumatobacter sp.]|jgi:hypothetical protein|uniref:hypothetical protein n=1 Tax=Ilumatobacter sp. TaxID=1967498 RepID=UPI00391DCEDF